MRAVNNITEYYDYATNENAATTRHAGSRATGTENAGKMVNSQLKTSNPEKTTRRVHTKHDDKWINN